MRIPIFLACIQLYLAFKVFRFTGQISAFQNHRRLIRTFLALFFAYTILPYFYIYTFDISAYNPHPLEFWGIRYPLSIWHSTSIALAVLFLAKDIITMLWSGGQAMVRKFRPVSHPRTPSSSLFNASRRIFLAKASSIALAVVPITANFYSAAFRSYTVELTRLTLSLPNLPRVFDGLTIAQVSDLHAGIYLSNADIQSVVDKTNALAPDIIMLTGDFVASEEEYIAPCAELLTKLKAKIGIYSCMGNHDHWTNTRMVVESLRDADLGLLINEHTVIERQNHRLYIAGVEDPWSGRHDMDKTLAGIPPEACTILMSHQPDLFDDAAARSVDLTISGHTHGGQITYPILGHRLSLAMFMTPYIHGHFRKGASQLYVNAGIGFTGPPLRLNSPPEITLYTLVSPA